MATDFGRIAGETPIDDVSGLLVKGIRTRNQLNQCEAENIALCASKYLVGQLPEAEAPFTFDWMIRLHAEMFGKVWKWAGTLRQTNLNLGCPWPDVGARMLDLEKSLPYWSTVPALEQAALLHHGAIFIHPFLNGNGRWSRMLANIWLHRQRLRPTEWPEPQLGDTSPVRQEYLEAVRSADKMDIAPLVQLHRRFTPAA